MKRMGIIILSLFLIISFVGAVPSSPPSSGSPGSSPDIHPVPIHDGSGDDDFHTLSSLVKDITKEVYCLLGPVAMLLVVVAAVVYAVGQVGTSEMRAKAQSWATWALVGAVMAFVIKVVGMMIVTTAFPSTDTSFLTCS